MIDLLLIVLFGVALFVAGFHARGKAEPKSVDVAFKKGYRSGFAGGHAAGVNDACAQMRAEALHAESLDVTPTPQMAIIMRPTGVQ